MKWTNDMAANPHQISLEQKRNTLKKRYASYAKNAYALTAIWLIIGILNGAIQWLNGRGLALTGLVLLSFGVIAYTNFDSKRILHRYKKLSLEEIEHYIERYSRYKKVGLLFGRIGLVDAVMWLLIGLIIHGSDSMKLMLAYPVWFYAAVVCWAPWFFCTGRLGTLHFIQSVQSEYER